MFSIGCTAASHWVADLSRLATLLGLLVVFEHNLSKNSRVEIERRIKENILVTEKVAAWFRRSDKFIKSDEKRPIPDGVWVKCPSCSDTLFTKELQRLSQVCPTCNYHFRITSLDYIDLLLDADSWVEHDGDLSSKDPLDFRDSIKYSERVVKYQKKSGLKDAIRCIAGDMNGRPVELAAMDFSFMGGSVGSVVGEKAVRAIARAIKDERPLIIISSSGGMRMQEGLYSLMQMAKVSAALVNLAEAGLPYISVLTNPTTGGTTASFSMLGDVIISEPGALIGFAGPRVIKQTIGQDLPEGFQSAEFVLEHGFIDIIVSRPQLKENISNLINILRPFKPLKRSRRQNGKS